MQGSKSTKSKRPIRGRAGTGETASGKDYESVASQSQYAAMLYEELATLYQKWSDEDGQDVETSENNQYQDLPAFPTKREEDASQDYSCCHSVYNTDGSASYNQHRSQSQSQCQQTVPDSPENSLSSSLTQMSLSFIGNRNYLEQHPSQRDSFRSDPSMTSSTSEPTSPSTKTHFHLDHLSPTYSRDFSSFFTDGPLSLPTTMTTTADEQARSYIEYKYNQRHTRRQSSIQDDELGAKRAAAAALPAAKTAGSGFGSGSGEHYFCSLCKKNGETREFYTSHVVKDSKGNVVCPVLRDYVCPACGATGPYSHTISYCPVVRRNKLASDSNNSTY